MTSLSKSKLWEKMQEYYNNIGPEAWQEEVVPLQISSNKNLARAYANIILAQINDWHMHNPQTNEPFYIIEIGAGHGKFSYYVLKCLQEFFPNFNLPLNSIKFIVTDVAEKNIEMCEQHPAFKDFINQGVVDFAIFNAMDDKEIKLRHSGQTIKQGDFTKPIFMLSNYLFDSLAHDAFQVRDKKLHEVQIKIDSDADWEEYFAKAKFSYEYLPVNTDYYEDPVLNQILTSYEKDLDDNTFMIPIGGIDCVNELKKFTSAHLVLLLADKGHANIALFDELNEPDITEHGSVSLMVNFDALKRYFLACKGEAMLMANTSVDFQVACYCTEPKHPIPHTKHAFMQELSGASPQDIVDLCYYNDEVSDFYKNLDQMLAILNLTMWDPNIFHDFSEMILDKIEEEDISIEQDAALLHGMQIVWDYFFKLEKTADLPFALGSIYYALDEYELAIKFYKLSIDEFGINADNLYNLAITYQAMDDDPTARDYAKQTLNLDPEYTAATDLLAELA